MHSNSTANVRGDICRKKVSLKTDTVKNKKKFCKYRSARAQVKTAIKKVITKSVEYDIQRDTNKF